MTKTRPAGWTRLAHGVAVAACAMLGACSSIQVRTATDIEAPPAVVWDILIDLPRYPEWNPYHLPVLLTAESNPVQVGDVVRMRILRPDGNSVEVDPEILRVEPKRELAWGGGLPGVFYGEHVFRLEALPNGGTHLVHNEDFDGAAVGMADLPPAVLRRGYELVNAALKARAEATVERLAKASEE